MSFPANPSNGQAAIVNKITYQYSSATNTWTKLTSLPTYLANLTANNSITIGNLTMNGTLTNITAAGNLYIGGTGVFGTALNYVPANAPVQVGFNINNYSQFSIQNANAGNNASTDIAAIANNGSDNDTYVDMGIVGSGYSQASYNLYNPNDGYLIVSGNTITRGGNLILNTYQANDIIFATGGTQKNNEVMRVTSANVVNIKSTNTSTSTTTGALTVAGGAGITGNLYVGGNVATTGNLTVSGASNKLYFADGTSQSTAATGGLTGVFAQAFTTTGSGQTFTIPAGVTALKVTAVGGGGSGAGGGGGAGGAAIAYLTSLTPGNTLTVTVGTAGGTSSVASGTQSISTITATGGSSTSNFNGASGGSGSGGSLNFGGGGGGGSTSIFGGGGGNSIFGGGGYGRGSGGTASGGNATAYGGGGGGGTNTCGLPTGGSGYQGVVIFEW